MTRLTQAKGAVEPLVVAALHQRDGHTAMVCLRRAESGALSYVEARTVEGDVAIPAQLAAWGVNRVVRVAPERETLCRCSLLPVSDSGEESLAATLTLLAEAELPLVDRPYRRAAGLIPDLDRPGSLSVLFTGWNGPERPEATPNERWISLPAALSAIRGNEPWGVWFDPTSGVVCIMASGVEKSVARLVVETPGAATEAWSAAVADAVSETAALIGVERVSRVLERGLTISDTSIALLRRRVSGITLDQQWLGTYAIALGAAIIGADPRPTVHSLASMLAVRPPLVLTPAARAASWFAPRGRAIATIVACLVILVLAPLGAAWGRYKVLSQRASRLESLKGGREAIESGGALYAQLDQSRWPMTKLIADLSGAAPVGVSIQSLRLSPGQGLTLRGSASAGNLVNQFQAQLSATRVFTEVTVGRVESRSSEGGVEFDLTAKVSAPHLATKPAEDFVAQPLAERLYGPGASNKAVAAAPERSGSRRRDPSDSGDSRRLSSTPGEPPKPITDAEIGKLDRDGAMKEWAARKSFVTRTPSLDRATKDRLDAEVAKLKGRMDALKGGGT